MRRTGLVLWGSVSHAVKSTCVAVASYVHGDLDVGPGSEHVSCFFPSGARIFRRSIRCANRGLHRLSIINIDAQAAADRSAGA
jgi:hypothetical protein